MRVCVCVGCGRGAWFGGQRVWWELGTLPEQEAGMPEDSGGSFSVSMEWGLSQLLPLSGLVFSQVVMGPGAGLLGCGDQAAHADRGPGAHLPLYSMWSCIRWSPRVYATSQPARTLWRASGTAVVSPRCMSTVPWAMLTWMLCSRTLSLSSLTLRCLR